MCIAWPWRNNGSVSACTLRISPDPAPVQKRLRTFSAQFYDFRPVRGQIATAPTTDASIMMRKCDGKKRIDDCDKAKRRQQCQTAPKVLDLAGLRDAQFVMASLVSSDTTPGEPRFVPGSASIALGLARKVTAVG